MFCIYFGIYCIGNLRISRIKNFEMFAKINSKNEIFTKKCNNYPIKLLFLIIRNTYKQYFIRTSQNPKIIKIVEKTYFFNSLVINNLLSKNCRIDCLKNLLFSVVILLVN
jgi:hypothetical protein